MASHNPIIIKQYDGVFSRLKYVYASMISAVLIITWYVLYYVLTVPPTNQPIAQVNASIWQLLLGISVVFPVILIYALNQFPTIWSTEQGLYISFCFTKIFLPWNEITQVIGVRTFFLGRLYVYAKNISFFHYLYGLERSHFGEAFIIDPTLNRNDLNELLHLIEVNTSAKILVV